MRTENSFFKENKIFTFSLALMVSSFIGGLLYAVLKPEEPPRTPSFTIRQTKSQPALSSPMITAKIVFDAIKEKDADRIHPCLITEQEFNKLKAIETLFLKIGYQESDYSTQFYSYETYKEHLKSKINSIIAKLDSQSTEYIVTLDSISRGQTIESFEFEVIDNSQLYVSLTDQNYAKKQFKISLPPFIKMSDNTYRLLL